MLGWLTLGLLSFAGLACQKYKLTQDNLQVYKNLEQSELRQISGGESSYYLNHALQGATEYGDLATHFRDLREFTFSEELSAKARLWAERAKELQSLSMQASLERMTGWLSDLTLPPPAPRKPKYFAGADAFEAIANARSSFESIPDRLCALASGVPLLPALAHLDAASDWFQKKVYARALFQAERAKNYLVNAGASTCKDLDQDQIPEPLDACPREPESRNGYEDEDGCPDQRPPPAAVPARKQAPANATKTMGRPN